MVRIKTCRLTRNPQLGDPFAWLNLTLADGRELDDVALHRSRAAGGSNLGYRARPDLAPRTLLIAIAGLASASSRPTCRPSNREA
jgi:hypothetical protein